MIDRERDNANRLHLSIEDVENGYIIRRGGHEGCFATHQRVAYTSEDTVAEARKLFNEWAKAWLANSAQRAGASAPPIP